MRYTVPHTRRAQGSVGEDAGRANSAAREEERGRLTSENGGGSGESDTRDRASSCQVHLGFPPRTKASRLEWEARLEKMEADGMEGARGTKPYTKRIPAGKPNTGQLHRTVRDGPLNGPVGATNHTLTICWGLAVSTLGARQLKAQVWFW